MPAPEGRHPLTDAETDRALDKLYGSDTKTKDEVRELKKTVDASLDYEKQFAEENRRTMIIPAPADFKPVDADRKIQLRFYLEKTKIRPREFLKYRIEIMNVGRQAIDYEEFKASLLKYGGLLNSDIIHFYVTDPHGKRAELIPSSAWSKGPHDDKHLPPTGNAWSLAVPSNLSKEEKDKWLTDTNARSEASNHFQVRILPGETLRSLGDGQSLTTFRTLYCEQDFIKTGTYRLTVELDDRPEPLTDEAITDALSYWTPEQSRKFHEERVKKALGPVSSTVAFEVVP